jgi:deoxyribodipyrimidine photo-lyase
MSYLRSYPEILQIIDSIDPVLYAQTRNHLNGAVTRLSPYISRGVITLPFIRERLLEKHSPAACEKLIQELAWREYFQTVWWAKGDEIFSDLRFTRNDWQHTELVSAIVSAETTINVIDEAIKDLYITGYLHNHVRMWIAAISCNAAQAHWYEMGRWMYQNLIDGDLASNFLSWQWVAGTSINKQYTVNQALINGCSEHQQANTWLSGSREEVLTNPPAAIRFSEPAELIMEYGQYEEIITPFEADVCLYTPWTLDPLWRHDGAKRRVLVIDTKWFDRFPVSNTVLDFIIRQGKTVMPNLEVFCGDILDLSGIGTTAMYAKRHQTNQHWPVIFDEPEKLFPLVTGYYPSFFAYYKKVQARYS